MKHAIRNSGAPILRWVVIGVFTSLPLTGLAQQFPVQQTPVENSLPQYPSNRPIDATPAVDFFQPAKQPNPNATKSAGQQPRILPGAVRQRSANPHSEPSVERASGRKLETSNPKQDSNKKNHVQNYDIYRDRNTYPIDPRKPCQQCLGSGCRGGGQLIGNSGQPYRSREPGGCRCDQKKPGHHPNFSVHWPRPFSARLDQRYPVQAAARYAPCQPKRLVDVFDGLSTFKLIDFKRTDSGYYGVGADRFGCLGESKLQGVR